MKLFGNKRHAARAGGHAGHVSKGENTPKQHRLSGTQRGLLMLLGSLLILSGTVFAVYKAVVRPMDVNAPKQEPEQTDPILDEDGQEEVFTPPTVIEIEEKTDEETGETVQVETEVPASHKEGFYNILICGTDDDGGRTDTIMIGRLNVKDHSLALMSIPRDTYITGSYAAPKINSVYGGAGGGEKGMEALKTKLAQTLGFEVDGYILIKLSAFIELVDLVDGVDFDVPQRMYYTDPSQDLYIDLQAGMQHLDGKQAMGLVRFRKGYNTQDIKRTQVQQDFLKALAKKCLKEISLANLQEMADIFYENVLTDLTIGNIAYFGQELLKSDFDNMFTYTLEGEAGWAKGLSVYALYLNKTVKTVNDYFNPYETEITTANVSIPQLPPPEPEPEPEPEEPEEPLDPEDPWGEEEFPDDIWDTEEEPSDWDGPSWEDPSWNDSEEPEDPYDPDASYDDEDSWEDWTGDGEEWP